MLLFLVKFLKDQGGKATVSSATIIVNVLFIIYSVVALAAGINPLDFQPLPETVQFIEAMKLLLPLLVPVLANILLRLKTNEAITGLFKG